MPALRPILARLVHAAAFLLPLLVAAPGLAVTDKRAVIGAAADIGPSIPEPSSILLFLIGGGVVGYGVHRRRSS